MAKVTITIEDKMHDGVAGLRISSESDPTFPDNDEEMTIAQNTGIGILQMIVNGMEEVEEVDQLAEAQIDPSKH